jgi:hypothetical protein
LLREFVQKWQKGREKPSREPGEHKLTLQRGRRLSAPIHKKKKLRAR